MTTPCQVHRLGRVQRQAIGEISRERGREPHRLVAVRWRPHHHGIRTSRQVEQVQLAAVSRRIAILRSQRSAARIEHLQIQGRRRIRRHDVTQRKPKVLPRRRGEAQRHVLPRLGRGVTTRHAVDRRGTGDRRGQQQGRIGRFAVIGIDEDHVRPIRRQTREVQFPTTPTHPHAVQLRPIRRVDGVIDGGIGRCRALTRDLQCQSLLACHTTEAQAGVLPTPRQVHRLGRVQRQAICKVGRERSREMHRLVAVRWRPHHHGIRSSRQVGQVHLAPVTGCIAILGNRSIAAGIEHLHI